jgi:hypothetical protein
MRGIVNVVEGKSVFVKVKGRERDKGQWIYTAERHAASSSLFYIYRAVIISSVNISEALKASDNWV